MSTFVEKRKQFMDVLRGVNARDAAKAMNRLTPGIVWTNCSKGHIADMWAKSQTQRVLGYEIVRTVTIASFREALQQPHNKENGNGSQRQVG